MIPAIGTETHTLPVPYKDQIWNVGGLVLNVEQMVVIAATALLSALLYAMFRYSKIGIAMQASSQNQLAAYYMGIPVKRLNGLVWGLAAAVAAIAGVLLAPITFVYANMGFIGLKAIPGGRRRRLRQPAGRHRRRPRHRRRRSALRLLPARGLQGHRAVRRRPDHARRSAERAVRREAAQEGLAHGDGFRRAARGR